MSFDFDMALSKLLILVCDNGMLNENKIRYQLEVDKKW